MLRLPTQPYSLPQTCTGGLYTDARLSGGFPCPWSSWEPSGAWPQTTPPMSDHYWPQNDQIPAYLCTQTAPGPLEQNYPAAMAYVPWQQWQATYAPERGLAQGTIFPEMDLQFNYGRCSR